MNEEIMQLANQCFIVDTRGDISANEYMIERFAQLIVQECANIADNPDVDMLRVGLAIKQHFGVE